jgi:hypothetical protein
MFHDIHRAIETRRTGLDVLAATYPAGRNIHKEIEIRYSKYVTQPGDNGIRQPDLAALRKELDTMCTADPENWTRDPVYDPKNPTHSNFDIVKLKVGGYRDILVDTDIIRMLKIPVKPNDAARDYIPEPEDAKYPFRIAFSLEITDQNFNGEEQTESRQRNRISYIKKNAQGDLFRIDTTEVVESVGAITRNNKFEVEVEIIQPLILGPYVAEIDLYQPSAMELEIERISTFIICHLNNTKLLYNIIEMKSVQRFISAALTSKKEAVVSDAYIPPGPINKPVDMSWEDLFSGTAKSFFTDLNSDGNGPPTYTVTVKLNGTRMLVYYSNFGVYLFNPMAGILSKISNRPIPELQETILDGELIMEGSMVTCKVFKLYLFDCLFVWNPTGRQLVDIRGLNHYDPYERSRIKACDRISIKNNANDMWNDNLRLILYRKVFYPIHNRKSFYEGNTAALKSIDIFNPVDQRIIAIENPDQEVLSDGLVYTFNGPYLPPIQYGKKPPPNPYFNDARYLCGGQFFTTASQNPSKNRRWKPKNQLTIDFLIRNNAEGVSEMFVFCGGKSSVVTPLVAFKGSRRYPISSTSVVTKNRVGDSSVTIEDGQIGEFQFDKVHLTFKPLRLRTDKVQPNDVITALATWKLINDPIPRGILVGNIIGENILRLMRKFHDNEKLFAFHTIADEVVRGDRLPRLMDLGAGQGKDVYKWKHAGHNGQGFEVVALEPSATRVQKLAETVDAAGMNNRVNILQGDAKDTKNITRIFENLRLAKVDAVTMMHSLTFFFDVQESVTALIETIKAVLNIGGVFFCMALDGNTIYRELRGKKQVSVGGTRSDRPAILINKVEDPSGRAIFVRMIDAKDESLKTGQHEYLVDFDYFISRLESEGFDLIEDRYLGSDSIMNDTELWWSQMTRIVKFRYVGIENRRSERLDQLKEIMENAAHLNQAQVDKRIDFPLGKIEFTNDMLCTIGVLGDGSCFLHAILYAMNLSYRTMSSDARVARVASLRADLAKLFTQQIYDNIGFGAVAAIGQVDSNWSYNTLRAGLLNYTHWFGLEFLQFVSDQLNINIHLVWWRNDKLQVYKHAEDRTLLQVNGRHSVVLYWQGGAHFQPVGRVNGDQVSVIFRDDDRMITALLY